ncbi:hypothetical protein G7B40_023000 [Aetokthonos hydrillicola Thurmond2011]|jgi:hypothetical protein|uniref:Uncharacterized protein n=1 Tax=Aetokthonos hydrillicola Thurmond2011 TaxID=2712845 RepID=A0AAP5I9F6_9CYAN|nr:hypothetical protein [Aetokthonos hydrillicola]MBW4586284.1 hypothetical protein [Aetokthonos hydrillicola CCALA 1050]MDR9897412.1 hypothetical protein [Aetokthonos hydrillicola Thurmond2011]
MSHTDQTVQQIYRNIIDTLKPSERLRLAALILNDLTEQEIPVIDNSDTWSEQDQLDLAAFSLQYGDI